MELDYKIKLYTPCCKDNEGTQDDETKMLSETLHNLRIKHQYPIIP
jgi:hypothetical protein